MPKPIRVLIVEDSEDDLLLLLRELRNGGYNPRHEHVQTAEAMSTALARGQWDLIISDYIMPRFTGMAALELLKKSGIDIPFIVVSGKIGEEVAVEALKAGAHDYIVKGALGRLLPAIEREIREAAGRRDRKAAEAALAQYRDHLEDLVKERTAELQALNKQLSGEVFERKVIEEELRTHRDHLEDLVQERTAELQKTNEELEREIAERTESERRVTMTNTLLSLFTKNIARKEYLDNVAGLISRWSGCVHVGIRILGVDGTIPYEAQIGFKEDFLMSESCLSIGSDECVCPRIVGERPEEPDCQAMTEYGSFCSNNNAAFLEGLDSRWRSRYRGACERHGFLSVAVIPIRHQGKVLGALHVADAREGLLPEDVVSFLEVRALIVGEAIYRFGAEQALREQAKILESFLNETITPLVFLDRDFNFIRVNRAYAKACGRDVADFPGHNHFDFYPHGENEAIFRKVVLTKTPHVAYARPFVFPDHPEWGVTYWDWSLTPILDEKGETDYLVFSLSDVTEKTRLESIAEAVNTMNNIGYVFAGIRHEIGNPINSAKITLSVLKTNYDRYTKEKVITYLDRATEELSRVEYLLRFLKNYNMYEVPEFQAVDVRDFMEKLVSLVRDNCEKKGVALESAIESDVAFIHADPRALHQVFLNILTNALDACTGTSDPRIFIGIQRAFGMVLFKISDNGCGMTEEQQRNVYRPFYTTKPHGTGLGLVIVRKMLLKMNGTISITSRPAVGTSVDIYLREVAADHD